MQTLNSGHTQPEYRISPLFPPFIFTREDGIKLRELRERLPDEDGKKQLRRIFKTARQRARRWNARFKKMGYGKGE